MSASSFTDWQIACDHPGCGSQVWASNITTALSLTATELRRDLKGRGWTVAVPDDAGSRRRKDYCPHHNPDLAVRVRAALEDGGWAEFGSQAEAGKVILSAPGSEGSWRSLVTEQCASYLNTLGFETQITNGGIYVSDASR